MDRPDKRDGERKGTGGLAAAVLANILAAAIISASVILWHLLTSHKIWTWQSLPKFVFTIDPVIWTFAIPIIIMTIVELIPKYRVLENGPLINRVIDSMLAWPAFFAIIVCSGLHPGALPLMHIFQIHSLQHLETHFAQPFTNVSTFTSAYVLLYPFGLAAALLAQVVSWKRILVRAPSKEGESIAPQVGLKLRSNLNRIIQLLRREALGHAIREDSHTGKRPPTPLIGDTSRKPDQNPANIAFQAVRHAVRVFVLKTGGVFIVQPTERAFLEGLEPKPASGLRAAREIELAVGRIAQGYCEDALDARDAVIGEIGAAAALIVDPTCDAGEKATAVALCEAWNAIRTLTSETGVKLIPRYIPPGGFFTGTILEPVPIEGLWAARAVELAARHVARVYIRLSRKAGLSWAKIGAAIKWLPGSIDGEGEPEGIAEAAYSYAAGEPPPEHASDYRSFAWTCPACSSSISDKVPRNNPADDEPGHAEGCLRLLASMAEWRAARGTKDL
jgi:hypothetical protein